MSRELLQAVSFRTSELQEGPVCLSDRHFLQDQVLRVGAKHCAQNAFVPTELVSASLLPSASGIGM